MPTIHELLQSCVRAAKLEEQVKQTYIGLLKQATSERDELLQLLVNEGMQPPQSICRTCDQPMNMKSWDMQFCPHCK